MSPRPNRVGAFAFLRHYWSMFTKSTAFELETQKSTDTNTRKLWEVDTWFNISIVPSIGIPNFFVLASTHYQAKNAAKAALRRHINEMIRPHRDTFVARYEAALKAVDEEKVTYTIRETKPED